MTAALVAIPTFAETRYTIQNIDPSSLGFAEPESINNSGQVVGYTFAQASYFYSNGVLQQITTLAGHPIDSIWRINDSGAIAGNLKSGGGPFVQTADGFTILSHPGAGLTMQDFNNRGDVVGDYWVSVGADPGDHAFLFSNGVFTPLGSFGGPGNFSFATAVNNYGDVSGFSELPDGVTYPAFLYHNGVLTNIGTPKGTTTALVRAMNDSGTIVGEASNFPPITYPIATSSMFIYSDGQFTVVPSPAGRIMPLDINNEGTIVGFYPFGSSTTDPGAPFIYQDGSLIDLNTLIDPSSGWKLGIAFSINDLGQIVGGGSYNGIETIFLLTPMPEPTTTCLSMLALAVTCCRRRAV